jgi:hypothetical protein
MSKRLPTPENWPRFSDLYRNSVREEEIDQSCAPLPGLQQPAARITQGNNWDFNQTVKLNIESDGKFNFNFKGPYSALLSTYSSLAIMKDVFHQQEWFLRLVCLRCHLDMNHRDSLGKERPVLTLIIARNVKSVFFRILDYFEAS